MASRILGLMVTRNEAGRYLDLALESVVPVVDKMTIYDDASTDDTVETALGYGCQVIARPEAVPPFLVHEGRFRQAAWDAFCETVMPCLGDWVLAIDADEVVVGTGDPRELLVEAATESNTRGEMARVVKIPEVFDVREGWPYVRVDGWWGRIQGTRFFAWRPRGVFADRAMGSGSEPLYIQSGIGPILEEFWMLHLGYARKADRVDKHSRYSTRSGHGDLHVASILQDPDLARWRGPSVPGLHRHFA